MKIRGKIVCIGLALLTSSLYPMESVVETETILEDGHQADLNRQLLHAVKRRFTNEVRSLLTQGANIQARESRSGDTVLHLAVKSRRVSFSLIRLLLDSGADLLALNESGQTVFECTESPKVLAILNKAAGFEEEESSRSSGSEKSASGDQQSSPASKKRDREEDSEKSRKRARIEDAKKQDEKNAADEDFAAAIEKMREAQASGLAIASLVSVENPAAVAPSMSAAISSLPVPQAAPRLTSLVAEEEEALKKALKEAVKAGNRKEIEELFAKGAQYDWRFGNGSTILHGAVQFGHLGIVQWLAETYRDLVSMVYERDLTVLCVAAVYGRLEIVKWLAERFPALISQKAKGGVLPIDIARAYGKTAVVDYLKTVMPATHSTVLRTSTPAASLQASHPSLNESSQLERALEAGGLVPSSARSFGSSAPQVSSPVPPSLRGPSLLLPPGGPGLAAVVSRAVGSPVPQAPLRVPTVSPSRPVASPAPLLPVPGLLSTSGNGLAVAPMDRRTFMAVLPFIDAHVQINGNTALHQFFNEGEEVARTLVEKGADINAFSKEGDTVLMRAIRVRNESLVTFLLDRRVNIDAQNPRTGETALMLAASQGFGCINLVTLLIERGADTTKTDKQGKTFTDYLEPQLRSLVSVLLVQKKQ